MKKFIRGMLIAAGCFFAAGVILGIIGMAGVNYMDKKYGNSENYRLVRDTWDMVRKWDFRHLRGDGSGLVVVYDGIEFDENHDLTYGSFTDDSLRGTDIYNLDLEIGGGSLTICQGDGLVLKKDGGPECQYYIEGDTFYLKQRCPVGGGETDITLTLPEGIVLDEADIMMGAGEIVTKGILTAGTIEIEVDAGSIDMDEVCTDSFSGEVAAGSIQVKRLDAKECSVSVNMGNITLQESLVTGNLEADVNMGEINIFLRDSYENHDYEVDCNMGDITIGTENGEAKCYSGLSSSMELYGRHSDGVSLYDLNCDMGDIYVKFAGTEDGDDGAAQDVQAAGYSSGNGTAAESGLPALPELEGAGSEWQGISVDLEAMGMDFLTDNWPESIGRENKNTTADNLSFALEVSEPVTLIVSCVTEEGELDMEIEDERGEEIFEKEDMRTGDYEVRIDSPGTYRISCEMDEHTGSFWIRPKK